jgi:hypothetical protein
MEKTPEVPRRPEPAYSLVLYDAKTGQIVQVHHFGAMPGVELPAKDKLREMALRHAAGRHKREVSTMQVLEVGALAMKPKVSYRVSPSNRTLEEVPAEKSKET